jgi:hypothetical protein
MKRIEIDSKKTIAERIFLIRGKRIMLDRDLAQLYGVETKYLNRQMRRNINRFPPEFMFRLTVAEKRQLVPNCHRLSALKHSTALPYAFTEYGVAMLASVLKCKRAVKISIHIVKTFIKLRQLMMEHKELVSRLDELEHRMNKHDNEIQNIFQAIRQLLEIPLKKQTRQIGFHDD